MAQKLTAQKTVIVISGLVDATIKEYSPDTEFMIFGTIQDLGDYLDKNPIRANALYITSDVIGGLNSSISYLRDLVTSNYFLHTDRVIYITGDDDPQVKSVHYLIEELELNNWEVIQGSMSRAFITEVINGTFRDEVVSVRKKAVYRKPKQEYVKQQLRNKDSLEEPYTDDEADLSDIPDEEIPTQLPPERSVILQHIYIAGLPCAERSVFAFIAAQYLSRTSKTLLIESDPDYHTITEYSTKSEVPAYRVSLTRFYEDPEEVLEGMRNCEENLVIVECIDRIDFNYKYISAVLYYNLMKDFTYIISEIDLSELPHEQHVTIVIPSNVIGVLSTGEKVDKSFLPYCHFIAVNLKALPELVINSGVIVSKILSDILSTVDIMCPVVTMSSLRLSGTPYDLGQILRANPIMS